MSSLGFRDFLTNRTAAGELMCIYDIAGMDLHNGNQRSRYLQPIKFSNFVKGITFLVFNSHERIYKLFSVDEICFHASVYGGVLPKERREKWHRK